MKVGIILSLSSVTMTCCFFPYHCPSLSSHNAKSLYHTFRKQCNAEGEGTGTGTGFAAHHWPLWPSYPLFIFVFTCPRCQKMSEKEKKKKRNKLKKEKGYPPLPPTPALAVLPGERSSLSYLQKRKHERRDLLLCLNLCCLGRML